MKQLIATLILLLSAAAAAQQASVTIVTQPAWPPGEPVPVTVEIRRGEASGFARFYHDLPGGFVVENVESSGADFFWDNNQVNYVWTDLPEQQLVMVRYLVKADELLAGSFRINGRFDYVVDGRRRVSVYSKAITVNLDRRAQVEEAGVLTVPVTESEEPLITLPEQGGEKIEFRVQVSISSSKLSQPELENRIGSRLRHGLITLEAGTMYKYQSGSFSSYDEAALYLSDLKGNGVGDAFVVAYRDGRSIPVEEARKITEK